MVDLAKINRELSRLDSALRSGQLDLAQFRAERRRILLDFDERASTTQPGATHGSEITQVDPPSPLPVSEPPPFPVEPRRAGLPMGMLGVGFAALIVIGLGAWWFFMRPPSAPPPASMPAAGTAVGELPQDVAGWLTQSNWTDADLGEFLQRWQRLPPETVRAAADDPRIWLLRGQTEQRLRDARESESVSPSDAAQARTRQLEQIQAAIRAP